MINLIGDLAIVIASLIIATLFFVSARDLVHARRGRRLIGAGLVGIAASALIDASEAVLPQYLGALGVTRDWVETAGYIGYTVSLGLLTLGALRWGPLLKQLDREVTARKDAERSLGQTLDRARTFNAGLEALARTHIEQKWDFDTLVRETTQRLSTLLDIQRVSVWRLNEAGDTLECHGLYDASTGAHSAGTRILRAMNPAYFNAIRSGAAIVANDALTDPITEKFGPDYLAPLNIYAMLDAPIRTGAGVRGVVCCEHVGDTRVWGPEDIALASGAAQYIAVADLAQSAEILAADVNAALQEAKDASAAKSAFIANVSHELRTPLNGILGMADALKDAELPDAARAQAETLSASGRQLLGVLNDILDLSKIEAGHLAIKPDRIQLSELIDSTAALFESAATQKGVALRVELGDLPATVLADPLRIRQCLSNLIGNAVKFTDQGEIRVSAESRPVGSNGWQVSLTVRDTGCGVSPADQARLFERFTQADSLDGARRPGAGLGLFISREIARRMGGDVVLDRADAQGSQFTVSFRADAVAPAATPDPVRPAPAPAAKVQGLTDARILLVDDNEVNRVVARCFLEPAGADVVEAESGQAALDQFASASFDLVLLDAHMPRMSGEETLKRLRASGPIGATIPVIALTADAMVGDEARYLAMGMDAYVPKPVDKALLINSCAELISAARVRAERSNTA